MVCLEVEPLQLGSALKKKKEKKRGGDGWGVGGGGAGGGGLSIEGNI